MKQEKPKHIICTKCFNEYKGLQPGADFLDFIKEINITYCPFTVHSVIEGNINSFQFCNMPISINKIEKDDSLFAMKSLIENWNQ